MWYHHHLWKIKNILLRKFPPFLCDGHIRNISNSIGTCEIFLGLCPVLSGSTNVAKRLDVIVYPGHIRRVTGHARAECATSIRFQLITARTWCVGSASPPPPPTGFVLRSLSQSSIQFRIPIHPSNVGLRFWLDDNIARAVGTEE